MPNNFSLNTREKWGADLALRTYTTRLLGSDEAWCFTAAATRPSRELYRNVFGQDTPALFMKASGFNLATIEPEGHTPLDLEYLEAAVRPSRAFR